MKPHWYRRVRRGRRLTAAHLLPLTLVWAGCGDGEGPTEVVPAGNLLLSSYGMTFEGDAGGVGPGTVLIAVTSDGEPVSGLAVRVQYPEDAPTGWVDASLDAATTPATLSVTISTPVLAWGGYAAGVIVSSDDAGNGSQLVVISVNLECRAPSAGKVTVCGRLYDTGTDDVTHAALSAVAYDLVAYAGNPTSATPLGTAVTDASGRYRFQDLDPPSLGHLLMIVDDSPGADDFVQTARALPAAAGTYQTALRLFSTRAATDAEWTTSAGNPFGAGTFGSEGAILSIFSQADGPTAGVQVTGGSSPVSYYFSDTDATVRSHVSTAATATGANGSALTVGGGFDTYSGSGAEPPDSVWSSAAGADVPGLILVILHSPVAP
jgi:hypothetical protein